MILEVLIGLSALSFLVFGMSCFTSKYMQSEFIRYGLGSFRNTVGVLQLLGGIALLIGYKYEWSLFIGSGGLALLMFLGVIVRIKINDGFIKSSPAFIYMVLNAIIFFLALSK